MSGLADYLDLLEPTRPGVVLTPTSIVRTSAAPLAPGVAARSAAPSAPLRRSTMTPLMATRGGVPITTTLRPGASTIPGMTITPTPTYSPGVVTPASSDPAADAARASCATFCADPANARECVPASAGGSGACSPWVGAAPSGGGGTYLPPSGVPSFPTGGSTGVETPTCPAGQQLTYGYCFPIDQSQAPSFCAANRANPICIDLQQRQDAACRADPNGEGLLGPCKKSSSVLPLAIAALVAWRLLRR